MINLVWLVPLFPLAGFLIVGLSFKRMSVKYTGWIASIAVLFSFLMSLLIFFELKSGSSPINIVLFNWIDAGNIHIPMELTVDPLSTLMMLVVTGVGFLIHMYSMGYMKDDPGYNRFFAYMNLFVFFMLMLVLGGSYVIMFIGWEGVGLSSYLLIGFWFKNTAYNNAAKKAFIMNRVGDLGFLLGMFLLFTTFGTFSFTGVFAGAVGMETGSMVITVITLLLFVGAIGKSAQIPLFTWLPDAMAGPTPVSALIHAATMVTAGIYMVARSKVLYLLAPLSMEVILFTGMITALISGLIATRQNDIKKILAYSTISQLGIMFIGLGAGAFTSSIFHLTTHAFFKALLFLAAGSIIHALGGEQDIRKMGGLKDKIKITWIVFLIGTLAITGIPPFSGFFSKDEILLALYKTNPVYWFIGVGISLLTVFYMFRLLYLTFFGNFRGESSTENHIHDSPAIMTVPLVILAILSLGGGVFNLPEYLGSPGMRNFLEPIITCPVNSSITSFHISHGMEMGLIAVTLFLIGMVILWCARLFGGKILPEFYPSGLPFWKRVIERKFYFDELYEIIIEKPLLWLSEILHSFFEIRIIDRSVESVGKITFWTGRNMRYMQTGNLGFYLVAMVFGIVAVLFFAVFL